MRPFDPRGLLSKLGRPKIHGTLLVLGALSVGLLGVGGGFEHSPRLLHQIAWGLIALGVFGWMGSSSDSKPSPMRGAAICLLQYLLVGFFILAPSLSSDGDFYYGMTRTMLWNRDLNTMEEGARFSNSWMVERAAEGSAYGYPYHPFPIGVSLLWIPFVGVGHLEASLLGALDPTLTRNGYSEPYLRWLAIGTAAFGAAYILFGYLMLRLRFEHALASRAVLGTLLATPGFYYAFRDTGFPHAASAAAIALFLWLWLRSPERSDWMQIFLLAIALSLAALIRWQNCLFAAAPMIYWCLLPTKGPSPKGLPFGGFVQSGALAGTCLFFCFPQIAFFRLRGPDWLSLQHGGPQDFSWSTPSFFSLLFDGRYGLLPWHPFYLLCGIGGLLYLSRGRLRPTIFWSVWFLLWIGSAYLNQEHRFAIPLTLTLTIFPALYLLGGRALEIGGIRRPLGLAFLCAGIEVWINASYLLYHGGGDYGNRLIADLIPFAALGFAHLLSWARMRSLHGFLSLAYTVCFLWSFALLWKAAPKFTRSPVRLTEIFSHSTPFASMAQGLAHLDWALFFSGLWTIAAVAACVVLLHTAVAHTIPRMLTGGVGARRIVLAVLLLPVATTLWFWIDFRRVDAALYLDNRESGGLTHLAGAELWRHTFNTELSPFIPPGRDHRASEGRRRFHEVLGPARQTQSWLLPKKWPEGKPVHYVADRLTLLSRVWADRPVEEFAPVARIEIASLNPPATRTFTLRSGVHTARPTELSLPPSSPDWHHRGVGALPRFFASQFLLSPIAELEVLKISLIPEDVTLELGAIWFSRSPNDAPAAWIDNPGKNRTPEVDRLLFGGSRFEFVAFPPRPHPEVGKPPRSIFPRDPNGDRAAPDFPLIQDPWRLSRDGVPFALQYGNWRGERRADYCVLTPGLPRLALPLEVAAEGANLSRVHAAVAAAPRPKGWEGGPIASLRARRDETVESESQIHAGRDAAFWGEPYLRERNLIWKEPRGVLSPVGMVSTTLELPDLEPGPIEWSIELSEAAREKGVELAVFGLTLEFGE